VLINGTSFSDHLIRLLRHAGVFRDVRYLQYFRQSRSRVNLKRNLKPGSLVIFEQWQASRLTVNITEFIAELERQSPPFRRAMRRASKARSEP
jgi:hypothetical protein